MDKEQIKSDIGKVLDEAQDKMDYIKNEMDDKLDETREKLKCARKKAKRYIEDNPEKSVLMAAGVGAIAGIILASIIARKK